MKKILCATAMVMMLALVAGCSQKGFGTNLTVEPHPVPGVDWTKYKTWSFGRQGEYVVTGNEVLDDPTFRKSVGDNTIEDMNKLGYTHVNADPDLLIMFHVMVEDRSDEVVNNPAYADFDMQWAHQSSDSYWQEGTLMLLVIDAKSHQQIWGSTAKAELDKQSDFQTKKERFNKVVSMMLEDFPKRTAP